MMDAASIQEDIKEIMKAEGITYRQIAEEMKCTFQNVWNKLNNRPEPTFSALRHIVNAMGYDFGILSNEPGSAVYVDAEKIFRSAEERELPYSAVAAVLEASKVHLYIRRNEAEKNPEKF